MQRAHIRRAALAYLCPNRGDGFPIAVFDFSNLGFDLSNIGLDLAIQFVSHPPPPPY